MGHPVSEEPSCAHQNTVYEWSSHRPGRLWAETLPGIEWCVVVRLLCWPPDSDGAVPSVFLLSEASQVFSWGYGALGRLGHGDTSNIFTPKVITGLLVISRRGDSIVSVGCGGSHSGCITSECAMQGAAPGLLLWPSRDCVCDAAVTCRPL